MGRKKQNLTLNQKKDIFRRVYINGERQKDVAKDYDITERAVRYVATSEDWKKIKKMMTPEEMALRRIDHLMFKEEKTKSELKELGILLDFSKKPNSSQSIRSKEKGRGVRERKPNEVDGISFDDIKKVLDSTLLQYQKKWLEKRFDNNNLKSRFILKSRKIGATWYFAREAFLAAVGLGHNQIFISASKRQAEIFRLFIVDFALKNFGLKLKGRDEVRLSNGACLYFLSTNSATAQGYEGDVYYDEVFWIPKFGHLEPLASGIATHKQFKITYFSTASSKSHDAYPLWTGETRKKDGDAVFQTTHSKLKNGLLCCDGIWRQMVNIHDAINDGASDFFDLEDLKRRNPGEKFKNLYECKFLDESQSVFSIRQLNNCLEDGENWQGVDFNRERPAGYMPVWVGVDPSSGKDDSSAVIALPPSEHFDGFRVLETVRLNSSSFSAQSEILRNTLAKYNVEKMAVDATNGIGVGLLENIRGWYPQAQSVWFSPTVKNAMIEKTMDIISQQRLAIDNEQKDIVQCLLMVKKKVNSNGHLIYYSDRNERYKHADAGWALMSLLQLEPMNIEAPQTQVYC